ncbi:hypothetical protein Y1Q_0015654 [Alligator mississippiensis]|uniref:Uncharacterized protein n=1 Tax=Alligator mississippiensis TaxID=8496 RepID=A0A151NP36_ALLMI|nr:hypothetical protein Y1Q_0015654 [Alligator mississippiensis]
MKESQITSQYADGYRKWVILVSKAFKSSIEARRKYKRLQKRSRKSRRAVLPSAVTLQLPTKSTGLPLFSDLVTEKTRYEMLPEG